MNCTAFPSGFIIRADGGRAPSCSFLTSWPRPKILSYLTLVLKNSPFHCWTTFFGDDRDELLLCPIQALRRYFLRTEQYRLGIEGLLVSTGCVKKRVSHNTISFRLLSVISMARASASEEDCRSLRVSSHEVRKLVTFLLFKRNCAVHQVLKAGTWSSQSTFSDFYLRDVTYRHLDTLSIGPLVAAQQVV